MIASLVAIFYVQCISSQQFDIEEFSNLIIKKSINQLVGKIDSKIERSGLMKSGLIFCKDLDRGSLNPINIVRIKTCEVQSSIRGEPDLASLEMVHLDLH